MNAIHPGPLGHTIAPTTLRLALLQLGYRPVPITAPEPGNPNRGKAPQLKNWSAICATADEAEVRRWGTGSLAGHTNTGLLLGELIGLDIDVPLPDLAERLDRVADALLGTTPLHRIGQAPKRLRCYRLPAPIRKIETPELFMPDGTKVQVEVLAEGQQFVGFGIHPGTGQPYTWPKAAPNTLPLAEVPVTSEAALREFVAAAEGVLRQSGGRTQKEMDRAVAVNSAAPASHPDKEATRKPGKEQSPFFKAVNTKALENLDGWFRHIFPNAWKEDGTGAWRVSSADLGRPLEEDLSMHPVHGGKDFGTRESTSAINLVMNHGGAPDAKAAAMWLCEEMRINPTDLGWKDGKSKRNATAAHSGAKGVDVQPDDSQGQHDPDPKSAVTSEAGAVEIERLSRLPKTEYAATRRVSAQSIRMGVGELDKLVAAQKAKHRGEAEAEHRAKPAPSPGVTVWPLGVLPCDDGLYFDSGDDANPIWLCSPIEVMGEGRDAAGEGWGTWLRWQDADQRVHTWLMPKRMLMVGSGELEAALVDRGLRINADGAARSYLRSALNGVTSGSRVSLADTPGWCAPGGGNKAYVLLDNEVIGSPAEHVILKALPENATGKMVQVGTLADWKTAVAAKAVGNPVAAFAICAALAGPLLGPLSESSGGFHFFGKSKAGKTLAIRMGLSVWGSTKKDGLLKDWRTTANALEGAAEECNDGILALDEIHQAEARDVVGAVYQIANESGKGRLTREAATRRRRTWRCVVLSTGEVDVASIAAKAEAKPKPLPAGAEIRLPSIPIDGQALWPNIHGHSSATALMAALQQALVVHHGTAIRPFLDKLTTFLAQSDGTLEQAAEEQQLGLYALLPDDADSQVKEVARRCAVIALAGEMAAGWDVLPWDCGEATKAVETILNYWLGRRGGAGSVEESQHIKTIRGYLAEFGASKFSELVLKQKRGERSRWVERNPDRPIASRSGWRRGRYDDDGKSLGGYEYLIHCDAWADICAMSGSDPVEVAKTLLAAGLLEPADGNNLAKKVRIPNLGSSTRCYVVKSAIFSSGEVEGAEKAA